jgi:hypothetical protein
VKKFHSTTNKTSLFLVFILTAGTLTVFFPPTSQSMIDVSALKDVEKDQCNNINPTLTV